MIFLCRTVCKFPFFVCKRSWDTLSIRGDSHTKVRGMLFVSLWGVDYRFWSLLGCLGWKVTIFSHSGIAWYSAHRNLQKNALTLTTQKSPLGVSLSLNHQHSPLWEVNWNFPTSKHPRYFYMGAPPPPPPVSIRCDPFLGAIIGDDMR